jgi:sulfate adenylyltransferase subunit 1
MTVHIAPPHSEVEEFLQAQQSKDVLRFITCGSVDDGKSTLIGRLLHDSKQLFDDQLTALQRDSRRHGTQGENIDFALLVDGLSAEREQGITIDVAYRFFSTDMRSFIVADTPGHEQYTRNMATGASTADLAVLLVDARKGLSRQTRRHSLLASMLGIRHLVLAINKMDLIGWSQNAFEAIMAEYHAFAAGLGFSQIVGIPLSALSGDNVVNPAVSAPWYQGSTLLQHLNEVQTGRAETGKPFRLPVQWINRRKADFRGYAGFVASGTISVGEKVRIFPSGIETSVARIVTYDGDLDQAVSGQSITLTLADEVDVSRGDVIATLGAPPQVTSLVETRLFWSGSKPLAVGDTLLLKLGTAQVQAVVEKIRHRIDPDTAAPATAEILEPNDIADVVLKTDRALALDPYEHNRHMGSFILIDRERFDTVGLGLVIAAQPKAKENRMLNDAAHVSGARPRGWLNSLWLRLGLSVFAGVGALASADHVSAQTQLLNVSYDPTRELYRDINQSFAEQWKKDTGETIVVRASHALRIAHGTTFAR